MQKAALPWGESRRCPCAMWPNLGPHLFEAGQVGLMGHGGSRQAALRGGGQLAEDPFRCGRLQIVLLQVPRVQEELRFRVAQALVLEFGFKKGKRAEHVRGLKQAVVRWGDLPDVGLEERVEKRVDQVGDLLLAVVVVDDDAVEALEEEEVVAQEHAHLARYPGYHLVVVRELGFPEDERLVRDVAQAHEVEQRPEQLAPSGQVHPGVVLLAPDQRGGVYGVVPGEALLGEVAPQVPYLLGDVDALVVEEQGDDVVGAWGS